MRRFFLWLLLGVTFSLRAQNVYELSGVVLDGNQPVKGATVTVLQTGENTTTAKNGRFVFHLKEGFYTIRARFGKKTGVTQVHLKRNLQVNVHLAAIYEELTPVVFNLSVLNPGTDIVTSNTFHRDDLDEKDAGKDIPYLIESMPSVVSTSDAGNGVGYTAVRIRGISPQQINVTINGIPLNDPESHSVYWVDVPDLVSSVQSMTVVRGLGTSKFGSGAFGAQIDLRTESFLPEPAVKLTVSYGSFNTGRISAKIASGLLNKRFNFIARFSQIHSDGYIDRATSDLRSYYVAAEYRNNRHRLTFIHFGGHEKTYQAWYGVDKETFETDPTFNYAGAIYDDQWNIKGFYDNEVDDYTQKHYQLIYGYQISDQIKTGLTLHYTKGYGYYEQYKQDQKFSKYGLTPLIFGTDTINHTDLIRRKWLDNDFFGAIAHVFIRGEMSDWLLGAGINRYIGDHFGRVIWARFASGSEIRHTYYQNTGYKTEANFYVKNQTRLNSGLNLFTDFQVRNIVYDAGYNPALTFDLEEAFEMHDRLLFLNPKIGLSYNYPLIGNEDQFYTFLGQTHREPNRTDYKENPGKPKAETLFDWELGYRGSKGYWRWQTNVFWMRYRNQLVYTGKIDQVGNPIRENVGKSYRAGWETDIRYQAFPWTMNASLSLSDNRNLHYRAFDGQQWKDYGNTQISFSPSVVGYMEIGYALTEDLRVLLDGKYVGKQFMDNRNTEASLLPAYHVENLHILWSKRDVWHLKSIQMKFEVFNLLNRKYASNGYMWGDTPYYFPQATRHYGLGLSVEL